MISECIRTYTQGPGRLSDIAGTISRQEITTDKQHTKKYLHWKFIDVKEHKHGNLISGVSSSRTIELGLQQVKLAKYKGLQIYLSSGRKSEPLLCVEDSYKVMLHCNALFEIENFVVIHNK